MPDAIDEYPRFTTTHVSGDIFQSELNIFFVAETTIAIFAPLYMNLTSISPVETFAWDSSSETWNFTTRLETFYSIFFLAGDGFGVDYTRKNQIVAIIKVMRDPTTIRAINTSGLVAINCCILIHRDF